jgi:hypothetical protein
MVLIKGQEFEVGVSVKLGAKGFEQVGNDGVTDRVRASISGP